MFTKYLLALVGCTVSLADASCPQSPSNHRVDSLPYYKSGDLPCMYAANMSGSDKYDNLFFYWLFPKPEETTEEDSSTPLIIYMNGGPGSTSMNALFTENGPLYAVKTDEDDEDSYQVWYDAENSW